MTGRGSRGGKGGPVGIRGGTTTRTETGMYRKNFWISEEMCEALRRKAFEERRTETDIIREALGRLLGVE